MTEGRRHKWYRDTELRARFPSLQQKKFNVYSIAFVVNLVRCLGAPGRMEPAPFGPAILVLLISYCKLRFQHFGLQNSFCMFNFANFVV